MTGRQRLWWLAGGLVLALLMVPLFVVELPPLLDYPNHLARQWFLARGIDDPIFSRIYAPHWAIIPDIAVDAAMVLLQRFLPLYAAGKVVLGACLALQLAGVAAYSRALFGRVSYWPLLSALFAYNVLFLMGLVSFVMSIGLAFLAASVWILYRERFPVRTVIVTALAAAAIFFCHLLGVAFLGLLIGSFEIDRVLKKQMAASDRLKTLVGAALALIAAMLPAAILHFMSVPADMGGLVFLTPRVKLATALAAFAAYDRWSDMATAGAVLIFIYVMCKRKYAWLPRTSAIQFAVLAVLYVLVPFRIGDASWLHIRVAYMASLLLFAGIVPLEQMPARLRSWAGALAACLLVVRVGLVGVVWHNFNIELADFRRVIAPLEPGAKVLTVGVPPKANWAYWDHVPRSRSIAVLTPADSHLPALIMIERHAFWPLLFNVPSQHPISVKPAYKSLTARSGDLLDYQALWSPTATDLKKAPYAAKWRDHFDYVLVMNAGGIADLQKLLPDKLKLIAHADIAALYRVTPAAVQPLDATTSTLSSGPPSVAPPTAVTSIKLDETPRAIR